MCVHIIINTMWHVSYWNMHVWAYAVLFFYITLEEMYYNTQDILKHNPSIAFVPSQLAHDLRDKRASESRCSVRALASILCSATDRWCHQFIYLCCPPCLDAALQSNQRKAHQLHVVDRNCRLLRCVHAQHLARLPWSSKRSVSSAKELVFSYCFLSFVNRPPAWCLMKLEEEAPVVLWSLPYF